MCMRELKACVWWFGIATNFFRERVWQGSAIGYAVVLPTCSKRQACVAEVLEPSDALSWKNFFSRRQHTTSTP